MGYQAPVCSLQGSLPWIEEEHGEALHNVYARDPVDGAEAIYANHCMSASKGYQTVGIGRQGGWISRHEAFVSPKFVSYILTSDIHRIKRVMKVSFGRHP